MSNVRMNTSFIPLQFTRIIFIVFCCTLVFGVRSDPVEDKDALLDFIRKFPHSRALNWNETTKVCKHWTGVKCSADESRVVGVRLPGVGFTGEIPRDTLSRLSELQILSLRSNGISGTFPSDFAKLTKLVYLYLQFNKFDRGLDNVDFSGWKNLSVVNLSSNEFNGSIPESLSNLSRLTSLDLGNNSFSGKIPELNLPSLVNLNLANNNLTGSVPRSLSRFPSSSFSGNDITQMNASIPVVPPEQKAESSGKLGEAALLGIIIGGCVLGLLAFVFLLVVCCRRRKHEVPLSGKNGKGDMSPDKGVIGSQDGSNRLTFFDGCNYNFDLEDLLRASAEVLGKGTFGTAYKALLEDSTSVVVKRLKVVGVGKKEFEQQMDIVGRIRHENVVELRAYYYSKDEKLMVYDYYSQGSISAMLHAKRGEGRIPLDWDTRLRIAIGAARGIACIHTENGGKFVHGNIKSSNVFLNSQNYGSISDLGLATLMSPLAPPISRATGYKAPEVTDSKKSAQPADVYSFGVLLLELLTAKSPVHTIGGNEVVHLVRWVQSVVREEWTAEVFDVELMRYPNIEEEMVEMLQIAMSCVTRVADQRPKITDVVKMVEDIRRVDADHRHSEESKSESSTPAPTPPAVGTESSSIPP